MLKSLKNDMCFKNVKIEISNTFGIEIETNV